MADDYWATTLVLVRHGQARICDSVSVGPEARLTELGRFQAEAAASKLVQEAPFTAVYTSPLPRATESASPLCEKLGLDPIGDSRLTEFDLGINLATAVQGRPDLLIWRPDHRAANGESLGEFGSRVAAFCEEVVKRHPNQRIAVISHAGTIDMTLRWALGVPATNPLEYEFEFANSSISEIEFWPQGRIRGGAPRYAVLRRLGDVGHLSGLITEL